MTTVMTAIDPNSVECTIRRVRAEYLESPGLRLTPPQVKRFWHLDHETCAVVLDALESAQFLRRTRSGAYARADVW